MRIQRLGLKMISPAIFPGKLKSELDVYSVHPVCHHLHTTDNPLKQSIYFAEGVSWLPNAA